MGRRIRTIVLVLLVVIATTNTINAKPKNNQFCKFARLSLLCNKMVHGATNYNDALKNAFRLTLVLNRRNTLLLVPVLTPLVKKTKSTSASNILKTCQEKVKDIAIYIKDLIEAVDDENKDMIEYYLRTGDITLRDCVDTITEIEVPVPSLLAKAAKEVEDYKETALVVFLQAPIETVYNKPLPVNYEG
ncbi:hypothetical protein E3N88_15949 [Mikania micrantha]|uniref:Pectinesterase inhibitor domain-containing protein n=1 Tax=Mikania micrantha TaxID=192012 RepID=A0A5N6NX25_9ASTR|nr:hypothetical protein E3N88_15949 [Mikania micrantha]